MTAYEDLVQRWPVLTEEWPTGTFGDAHTVPPHPPGPQDRVVGPDPLAAQHYAELEAALVGFLCDAPAHDSPVADTTARRGTP